MTQFDNACVGHIPIFQYEFPVEYGEVTYLGDAGYKHFAHVDMYYAPNSPAHRPMLIIHLPDGKQFLRPPDTIVDVDDTDRRKVFERAYACARQKGVIMDDRAIQERIVTRLQTLDSLSASINHDSALDIRCSIDPENRIKPEDFDRNFKELVNAHVLKFKGGGGHTTPYRLDYNEWDKYLIKKHWRP